MRKKVKEISTKVVSAAVLSLALLSAIPAIAFAGNSTWKGFAQTPGSAITTNALQKNTNSSVIVNYSAGSSDFVGVNVLARNASGTYEDCTYYTSSYPIYYAYKGNSYVDVLNLAYETHGPCFVKVKFIATASGNHGGHWRPDYQ